MATAEPPSGCPTCGGEPPSAPARAPVDSGPGSKYFLVSARSANLEGTLGRAADDTERPGFEETDICKGLDFFVTPTWVQFDCARDFLIEGAFGEPVSLHDLRGRVVLLDWSAPWCGPCVTQANVLENLFQDYKDRDVVIVSVVMDEDAQGVDWYGRPNPIECLNWEDRPDPFLDHTFPCWVDEFTLGGFRRAFPLYNQHDTFPTNTILDTGMRVVYNGAGYIEPTIRATLDALVGSTDSCLH